MYKDFASKYYDHMKSKIRALY